MPRFEVEISGQRYEVEAPDIDTAVKAISAQQPRGGAAVAAGAGRAASGAREAAPKPSLGREVVQQTAEGFNSAIGDVLSFPNRAATAIMSPVLDPLYRMAGKDPADMDVRRRVPPYPFLGRETPATTSVGRIARSVGRTIGEDVVPGALTLGAAPAVAAIRRPATSALEAGGRRIMEGIAGTPGRAAAGELAAAAGAGAGMGMAHEVAPESGAARVWGGILGGLAPSGLAVMPSALAARGARAIAGRVSPAAQAREGRRVVGSMIGGSLTPERLEEARRVGRLMTNPDGTPAFPGVRLSLAEQTRSPALIRSQQQLEAAMTDGDLERAVQRYDDNDAAIRRTIEREAPPASADASGVMGSASGRLARLERILADEEAATLQARKGRSERLSSGEHARDLGVTIRDELTDARASTRNDMGRVAAEMGLDDETTAFNFSTLRRGIIDAYSSASKLKTGHRLTRDAPIIAAIKEAESRQTFPAMMEVRSDIADALDKAIRTNADDAEIRGLGAAKQRFDELIDEVVAQTDDPEIAQRYRAFRDIYRRDYIEVFEQGAAYRALARDPTRSYRIRDEMVAEAFFKAGDESAATQWHRIFGDNAEANAALEAAALDSLYRAAVREGVVDRELMKAWRRRHSTVLREFPNIANRVADEITATRALGRRYSQLKRRRETISQAQLTRDLHGIGSGARAPELVIGDAIRNPARMRQLVKSLRSRRATPGQPTPAEDGLARIVWDSVFDHPRMTDARKFWRNNAEGIKAAIGAERYGRAGEILSALEIAHMVGRPRGRGFDANPVGTIERTLNTGLNQISSRIFAVQSGRTSARYAALDIIGRAFTGYSKEQARKVFSEALYDPDLAKALVDFAKAQQFDPPKAARLYTYLLTIGLGPDQSEKDADRNDQRAAMAPQRMRRAA